MTDVRPLCFVAVVLWTPPGVRCRRGGPPYREFPPSSTILAAAGFFAYVDHGTDFDVSFEPNATDI